MKNGATKKRGGKIDVLLLGGPRELYDEKERDGKRKKMKMKHDRLLREIA